jgi:hypothetical protein
MSRINIYSEELGAGTTIVEKVVRGERFLGLRIWQKSCQELLDHSTPEDDDRSATTFWFRSFEELRAFIGELAEAVSAGDVIAA